MYRKLKEVANNLLKTDVREVYCMLTYTLCYVETVKPEMTSKELISCGVKEYLTFLKVDELLN